MPYDGVRFRTECTLAGKVYGRPFGVDVAFGDPMLDAPDLVVAEDVLGFAGIAPPTLPLYPVETHLSEKLHAYTMPRPRVNSRIKDLPDLALLASSGPLVASRARAAFEQTFTFRGTHPVPGFLPVPPLTWEAPYAALAKEDELAWASLEEAFVAVSRFVDPVLAGSDERVWDPGGCGGRPFVNASKGWQKWWNVSRTARGCDPPWRLSYPPSSHGEIALNLPPTQCHAQILGSSAAWTRLSASTTRRGSSC